MPSLRFLVRHLLRKNALCPDAESCPGRTFSCSACGHEWTALDANFCPRCEADWKAIDVEHGADCPHTMLLLAAMESHRGVLIRRVIELRNALQAGFTVRLDEVTAEEFAVLGMLNQEFERASQKPLRGQPL